MDETTAPTANRRAATDSVNRAASAARPGVNWQAWLVVLPGLLTVILWELAAWHWPIVAKLVSQPSDIALGIVDAVRSGSIWPHLQATLTEMAIGYVIGAVTGVLLGLLFGRVKLLGDIFNPYITLFNGIPKVALAPVFVIWFGIGLMSKIAIILTMVFFVVFINTFAGLRSVNEEYVSIVRIMGASRLQVVREVFLPATVPYILVGLRAGIPFSVIGAVVGEFIAATKGLGYFINYHQGTFDTNGIFVGVTILALLVVVLDWLLSIVERRLRSGGPKSKRKTSARDTVNPIIELTDVTKTYHSKGKSVLAVKDVTLPVQQGSFTTFIGPSGCGKSTLLKIIAGIALPYEGELRYKGREITSINTDIGFVTQDSNLFPWLTLIENVELALKIRGQPKAQRAEAAQKYIATMQLAGFEDHYPFELSGGMQKRGSIIRTLIYNPDTILMDEPFGPLDAQTRLVLQDELLRIWDQNKKTILFVTHDLTEAIALSDKVVLFTGRPGTVKRIFDVPLARPRNVFEIHNEKGFTDLYHEIWQYFKSEIKI